MRSLSLVSSWPALLASLMLAAFANGARAQSDDLPLTDLPGAAPAPAKPAKKRSVKNKQASPPPASSADTSGALIATPPAKNALPEVPMLALSTRIGVALARSPLIDEAASQELEAGLRGIAALAPLSQDPIVLRTAADAACSTDDDRCYLSRGLHEGLDSVVIARIEKGSDGFILILRQVAILGQKELAAAEGESPTDTLSLKAEMEALSCKMLVPAGCTTELALDAGAAEILYQGRPLPKGSAVPMRATLPVGLAKLSARIGDKRGPERLVPVTHEKMVGIAMTVHIGADGVPMLATPAELETRAAPAEAVVTSSAPGGSHWTRPVGFVAAGAGAAVLIAGLIEGAHAKSLQNSASAAYAANGGAWQESDLPKLSSANSAAHTANLLLLVGGIVAAAGLTTALVF